MSLFDFLKRKKEVEKAKKPVEKKTEKLSVEKEVKEIKPEKSPYLKDSKKKGFSYDIVQSPHISEKSTLLSEKNKYVFKVYERANKPEIKKSVEGIYGVDVLAVNIIKIPKKKRRIGRTEGFKKGHTKAIVTIKEGQKIETF